MTEQTQEVRGPAPVAGSRFRRNVVALGAAAGLTLAGLGVSGATTEAASDRGAERSGARAEARHGDQRRADHPRAERRREHRAELLEVAAGAIGITADELRAEMRAGKSIATVAREKGVDPATVVEALVADAQSRLEERFTKMVERTPGEGPGHDADAEAARA